MKFNRNVFWALAALPGLSLAAPAPASLSLEDIAMGISPVGKTLPPPAALEKRACASNNLLRLFRDKRYSAMAIPFCSSYVQAVVVTSASIAATVTKDSTVTPATITVTVTSVITDLEETTITITSYSTYNPQDTVTQTLAKRTAIPYPTWLPSSYGTSSVSSVCSCYNIVQPTPLTKTVTVVTGTQTIGQDVTLPPSTVTDVETATTVETSTIVAVATVEAIVCGVTPGCPVGGSSFIGFTNADTVEGCYDYCAGVDGAVSIQYGLLPPTPYKTACFCYPIPVSQNYDPTGEFQNTNCYSYYQYDLDCRLLPSSPSPAPPPPPLPPTK
ncbi:hypothetical protein TWF694_001871 [Orbilia ellipsospora]|uniref:Uncharacterized protein n=1 Tax=Orbilia ellipsospora TaxID=2528407 RepID=A0AAV9X3X4_9PEZI